MRLVCPFCGDRELDEFQFRQLVPEPPEGSAAARVYDRVDRPDQSVEYWQHLQGCRTWLVVRRDPTTATVVSVHVLGGAR